MAMMSENPHSISLSSNTTLVHKKMRIQVFHTSRLQGNHASVVLATDTHARTEAQVKSLPDESEVLCWVWPHNQRLHIRCHHHGQPIRFCGHGLLASVYAWRCYHLDEAFPLNILSEGNHYTATYDGGIWLHCARLRCQRTDTFPDHWFDTAPEQAAQVGGDSGYWIFRWPEGTDLKKIGPRLDTIARETRRGVIATSATNVSGSDVALRYFAPAYGQQEDSATGSAAVVLADYWGQPSLRLEQHSASGGFLRTRLSATSVALSGAMRGIHEQAGPQ